MNKKLFLLSIIGIKADPFMGINLSCNLYSFKMITINPGILFSTENTSIYCNLGLQTSKINGYIGYIYRKNSKKTINENASIFLEVKYKTQLLNLSLLVSFINKVSFSIMISKEHNEIFNVGVSFGYSLKETNQEKAANTTITIDTPTQQRQNSEKHEAPFNSCAKGNFDVDNQPINNPFENTENTPQNIPTQPTQPPTSRTKNNQNPDTIQNDLISSVFQIPLLPLSTLQPEKNTSKRIPIASKKTPVQGRSKPATPKPGANNPITPKIAANKKITPRTGANNPTTPKIAANKKTTPRLDANNPITPKTGANNPTTPKTGTNKKTTPRTGVNNTITSTSGTNNPTTPKTGGHKILTPNLEASKQLNTEQKNKKTAYQPLPDIKDRSRYVIESYPSSIISNKVKNKPKIIALPLTKDNLDNLETILSMPVSTITDRSYVQPVNPKILAEFLKMEQKEERQKNSPNLDEEEFKTYDKEHEEYFKKFNFDFSFYKYIKENFNKIQKSLDLNEKVTINAKEKKEFIENTKEYLYSKKNKAKFVTQKLAQITESPNIMNKITSKANSYKTSLILIELKKEADNIKNDYQRRLIKNIIYHLFELIKYEKISQAKEEIKEYKKGLEEASKLFDQYKKKSTPVRF